MKKIDKTNWESGPWNNEPDMKHWIDKETQYQCLIFRNQLGALCGYVGLPKYHPYYGTSYNDIEIDIEVHGGLTFSDFSDRFSHGLDIDKLWLFGFDCAHFNDIIPNYLHNGIYRTIEYVENQCAQLAKQLKELELQPISQIKE